MSKVEGPSRSAPELGPFAWQSPPQGMSYVSDVQARIIEDATGAGLQVGRSAVDRRTACLNQADAFRELAVADPEHHDLWIDEAIKWLERAREASTRVAVTFEIEDGCLIPKRQPNDH